MTPTKAAEDVLVERLTYLIHFHIYDQAEPKDVQGVIDGLAERDSWTADDGWIIVKQDEFEAKADAITTLLERERVLTEALEALAGIKADDGDDFSAYPPEAIIRCELTAGDIHKARAALTREGG